VAVFPSWNFRFPPALPWAVVMGGRTEIMTSSLLISLLVTFLVIILILYLVNLLPIDGRAKQIVRIIVIIIGVLSLLKYIAVL
jgi:heme A synthase